MALEGGTGIAAPVHPQVVAGKVAKIDSKGVYVVIPSYGPDLWGPMQPTPWAAGQVGASLPTSPVDGQEFYFIADATNGVVWHLRYRAASVSAYKWELVGGSPLTAVGTAADAGFSNTVYADLVNGPQIVLPLAGDYIVDWSSDPTNTSGKYTYTIPYNEGSGLGANAVYSSLATETEMAKRQRLNGCTATVLKLRRRVNEAVGTGTVFQSDLSAIPVRVG